MKIASPSFFFVFFFFFAASVNADLLVSPDLDRNQSGTVPSLPLNSGPRICRLDLSDELFGGVNEACGGTLDRSRCCPVLASWLFAAHARYALQVPPANASDAYSSAMDVLPSMPDDSQECVNMLQIALDRRKVKIRQPNATCDTVLCFCNIRLHQITSLSCPAAFNVTSGSRTATPTAAVRNLEKSCGNSSYQGCTRCIGALQKLKNTNTTGMTKSHMDNRATKIFNHDCQLMGLTWLLAQNKTTYIPTVSAVLRAVMYSSHPHRNSQCSPEQEDMPLAVDSTRGLGKVESTAARFSCGVVGFAMLLMWMLLFL